MNSFFRWTIWCLWLLYTSQMGTLFDLQPSINLPLAVYQNPLHLILLFLPLDGKIICLSSKEIQFTRRLLVMLLYRLRQKHLQIRLLLWSLELLLHQWRTKAMKKVKIWHMNLFRQIPVQSSSFQIAFHFLDSNLSPRYTTLIMDWCVKCMSFLK